MRCYIILLLYYYILYYYILYIIHIILYIYLFIFYSSLSSSSLFLSLPFPLSTSLPFLFPPQYSSFHSSPQPSTSQSSDLYSPSPPFPSIPILLFLPNPPFPPSFKVYVSGLTYGYLYSLQIFPISNPNLTPHVLSEWMVEVCRFEVYRVGFVF